MQRTLLSLRLCVCTALEYPDEMVLSKLIPSSTSQRIFEDVVSVS